jgi:hypothetical protein
MGWTYLVGGVCACPLLHPDLLKQNPFGS